MDTHTREAWNCLAFAFAMFLFLWLLVTMLCGMMLGGLYTPLDMLFGLHC